MLVPSQCRSLPSLISTFNPIVMMTLLHFKRVIVSHQYSNTPILHISRSFPLVDSPFSSDCFLWTMVISHLLYEMVWSVTSTCSCAIPPCPVLCCYKSGSRTSLGSCKRSHINNRKKAYHHFSMNHRGIFTEHSIWLLPLQNQPFHTSTEDLVVNTILYDIGSHSKDLCNICC